MHLIFKHTCHMASGACALLVFASGLAHADVTYEGSQGIMNQIFEPAGCEGCHPSGGGLPPMDNYDDASSEIADILDRINRAPGAPGLMPFGGPKLSQTLLDLMAGWNSDGVLEWSPPQLTVTGHSALTLTSDNADLEGTLKENGRNTNAFFRYWRNNQAEPTGCPSNNSIFSGCTASSSPGGSMETGGDDIAEPITHNASGLNCATTYNFRAVSEFNGQFFAQSSPGMLSFATEASAFDADSDLVCDGVDNCPLDANTDQLDTDNDTLGDVCDLDDDADGINDDVDNCPIDANPDQLDTDNDNQGDICDPDDDNDGINDNIDNCPIVVNADQLNTDNDSQGDACDLDDDNDGVDDNIDNCPIDLNSDQLDTDNDTSGNVCDPDDDEDTIIDINDNCPLIQNPGQEDEDMDGVGDVCETEDSLCFLVQSANGNVAVICL